MLSVRLGWRGTRDAALHTAWRVAMALPAAVLPGLRARQWQLDRTTLDGCYLFDDEHTLSVFLADPAADRAHAILASAVANAEPRQPEVRCIASARRLVRPVFIIAAPRSGSTMLFDLLARAPGLWTQGGEGQGAVDGVVGLHPVARGYMSDRLDADNLTPDIEDCLHAGWQFGLRDRHGRRYDDLNGLEPAQGPRLLDKTTEHSLRVAFLAAACPDAQFILLYRDARQNVSSLMQAWRHGGFVRLHDLPDWPRGNWCFLLPPGWRDLRNCSLQAIATAQWEAANRWALHDPEMLDPARWIRVDYNELVANPRRVAERLCAFVGVEIDAHLAAHVARPLALSGTAISPPSVIKWRSQRELDVPRLETETRSTSAWLRSLQAGGSRTRAIDSPATVPPRSVRFACFLDEVAADAAGSAPPPDTVLVEPSLRFQLGATIPLGLATATRFRERFAADQPILWSRDPLTEAWRPFWVPRYQAGLFAQFRPGAPPPPCPPELQRRLRATGIVASTAERIAAEHRAAAARVDLGREFAEQGYCVVSAALSAAHVAALSRYYQSLIASGHWSLGDAQVARRHGWHNESVARFFHHQLTDFVGAIVGEPVSASYTYVSAYQQGAELEPHVDRKQCEYTLSLIIDETGGRSSDWPLWFLAGDQRRAVTLDVGQGVLFRGHDLPHWREAAPRPRLALSTLLLHYVPTNFRETLH